MKTIFTNTGEKNSGICLVSMIPSWVMIPRLPQIVHFFQYCGNLSLASKSVKAINKFAFEGFDVSEQISPNSSTLKDCASKTTVSHNFSCITNKNNQIKK